MKKILLSLVAIFAMFVVNAQTVLYSEDFPYDPNYTQSDYEAYLNNQGWLRITPVFHDTAYYHWHIGTYPNGQEAWLRASCYSAGVNHQTQQWAITPQIDASNATSLTLTFDNRKRFQPYAPLKVYISTDFAGDSASFASATWNEITGLTLDDNDGDYNWATNTSDISQYAGQQFYIAFYYESTDGTELGDGGVWDVDNIQVTSGAPSAVKKTQPTVIYPNPVEDVLYIMTGSPSNVKIYNSVGQLVLSKENVNETLNVSSLQSGVYMIRIETDGQVITKKLLKK